MKSSIQQFRFFTPAARRIALTFALATVIGSLSMSPALARDDNGRWHQDDNQRGWHQDRGHEGDRRQREWHGDRDGYSYHPEYRRPYTYARPVYVPPPVYYEPRQSPGISLFFPLDLRH